jgi:hypothetical protein
MLEKMKKWYLLDLKSDLMIVKYIYVVRIQIKNGHG